MTLVLTLYFCDISEATVSNLLKVRLTKITSLPFFGISPTNAVSCSRDQCPFAQDLNANGICYVKVVSILHYPEYNPNEGVKAKIENYGTYHSVVV